MSEKQSNLPTLRKLYADKTLKSYLDRISLTSYDITGLKVDAVVNAARADLLRNEKGTVDYDIHEAAGPMLIEECKKLDGCEVGKAKLTNGYKLHAKYIIHTVGPVYNSEHSRDKARQLESCYRSCLRLAVKHKVKTIAFPLISAGRTYGYPMDDAICIAFDSVRQFLSSREGVEIELVAFVTRSEEEKNAFRRLVPEYFPCAA